MHHLSLDSSTSFATTPGAHVSRAGVSYRVWAPDHRALSVRVRSAGKALREIPLNAGEHGYFAATDSDGVAGDRYVFVLPDGTALPDPASRFQPEGVHGWSECIDAHSYQWRTTTWQRPGWSGQSMYELHAGTFTPEGTFRAAISRLPHMASLGIEAIELMPVADFPGERNWGYDGVALFAPARCYGRPDDLRALIDAAHGRGLAVILDVVYNHLGPDGNYLGHFARSYFADDAHTPWGQGFNLSGANSGPVRDFFLANAAYWLDEFRVDGFRLDATHAIVDRSARHLLAEIAQVAHERGAFVIAEDERNSCDVLVRPDGSGHRIDAVWADDFHHEIRVALTGTQEAYFKSYRGSVEDIVCTLEQGWFYTGQPYSQWKGRPRGEPTAHLPPAAFVHCIENHDQVGNRARGERLEHLIGEPAFRAASALLCLSPYPPLLFMGQEWAASTPFLFFSDHAGELGVNVSKGRQREFTAAGLNQRLKPEEVPDPQQPETFERSKLNWDERERSPHASVFALYRACFEQRSQWLKPAARAREHWAVFALERALAIRYEPPGGAVRLLVCSLWGKTNVSLAADLCLNPPIGYEWQVVLDTRSDGLDVSSSSCRVDVVVCEEPASVLLVAAKISGTTQWR